MKRYLPVLIAVLSASLACSSERDSANLELDDIEVLDGKADGDIEVKTVETTQGTLVVLQGSLAASLWDIMENAGGFDSYQNGGLDYLYGYRIACASNGSAAGCHILSGESYRSEDFAITVHGPRFDSAASEIFGAIARANGIAPATVTETSWERFECGKNLTDVWCGITAAANTQLLEVSLAGLEDLGPDYVYEGWLITSNGPVTSGRFSLGADTGVSFSHIDADIAADSSLFVLTIEPAVGDDPAPSDTHVVAGEFDAATAVLGVEHPGAFGNDFSDTAGAYILETPSSAAMGDYAQGVWFVDPSNGMASLALPELPAGWAYEGWVVGDDGPVSTGRFLNPADADSDLGGPAAGPGMTPPFPGQDFISPARNLVGGAVVISIEPEPDNRAAPFAFKPLVDMSAEDVGPGVLQGMGNNAAANPSGIARWR